VTWQQFKDVLPIITLIVGYLGSLYTEHRRDRRADLRERQRRRSEFQRQVILGLQDDLIEFWQALQEQVGDMTAASDEGKPCDAGNTSNATLGRQWHSLNRCAVL